MRASRNALTVVACTFAAALFAGSSAALAGNPIYDSWAKHKPGTVVVMKGETEASGMKTDMEQTWTLKACTPEKCTVEMKQVVTVMGNKMDGPPITMEFPSAADPVAAKPEPGQPTPPPPAGAESKTSEETVTVAGKSYKATLTETKADQSGMKVMNKVWTSPEVPGTILKSETKTEGQMASTSKLEVTKVELK